MPLYTSTHTGAVIDDGVTRAVRISLPYATGSLTIATDTFFSQGKRLILTSTQRVTIAGTARLIVR